MKAVSLIEVILHRILDDVAITVIKYIIPQGYPQYEVLGSTATYSVFLDMALAPMPFYCTCPAFSYVVLSSRLHIMVSLQQC